MSAGTSQPNRKYKKSWKVYSAPLLLGNAKHQGLTVASVGAWAVAGE